MTSAVRAAPATATRQTRISPYAYFGVSAVFHYLGPAFAVLLFAQVSVLGVTWLRIASAAVVFALWRRPWRVLRRATGSQLRLLAGLGAVLATMNTTFYLAVDRLPLATVGTIEFLGVLILAAVGVRSRRNTVALCLAAVGVAALADVRLVAEPAGFAFAFANCGLFVLYVVLGHRIAASGAVEGASWSGIDQLGAAMAVAAVVVTPIGLGSAEQTLTDPLLLAAGVGVGVCSSVVPYVTDQLAMARLPRSSFALMLALLPIFATLIGAVVLHQIPTPQDLLGIVLVGAGVALHEIPSEENTP
ncbi:MAG TPA: EamA family transporter [Nocardioidaceae bacterium]|nr:EamA family transporter [Nocardioidaceae bacterium]